MPLIHKYLRKMRQPFTGLHSTTNLSAVKEVYFKGTQPTFMDSNILALEKDPSRYRSRLQKKSKPAKASLFSMRDA